MLYQKNYIDYLHGESIYSGNSNVQTNYGEFIERAFGHLPACFDAIEPKPRSECRDYDPSILSTAVRWFLNRFNDDNDVVETQLLRDLPQIKWLAWNFYQHHYIRAPIQIGVKDGLTISHDKFLDKLTNNNSHTNSVYFLQGDIGSGKTAFLNNLITCHGAELFSERKTWFLRVNVELIRKNDEPISQNLILEKMVEKLIKVLRKFSNEHRDSIDVKISDRFFAKQIRRLSKLKGGDNVSKFRMQFFEVVKVVSKKFNRKFLLIIDNLDAYFHQVDRYIFTDKNFSGDDDHISKIHNLIKDFHHGAGGLGDLNAALLFVIRFDSYASLINSSDIFKSSEDYFSNNKNLYTIRTPNWKEVVSERTKLVKRYIETLDNEQDKIDLENAISYQLISTEEPESMNSSIVQLRKLARYGLRDILDHVKTSFWVPELSKSGTEQIPRSKDDIHLSIITFMLHNRLLYSQRHSNFPNIFYVAIEQEEIPKLESLLGSQIEVKHQHTYFLKILLLKYIEFRNNEGIKTETQDIINDFCGQKSTLSKPMRGYFEELLVRECLGALAQSNQSNVIKVERGIGLTPERLIITNIVLTDRGKYFINSIYNKFIYLQLVVDDFDLRHVHDGKAYYPIDEKLNYSYLVETGSDYYIKQDKLLSQKSVDVVRFIAMLHAHRAVEQKRYQHALNQLAKLSESLNFPNTSEMLSQVLSEFEKLKATGTGKSINTSTLRNFFDQSVKNYSAALNIQIENADA